MDPNSKGAFARLAAPELLASLKEWQADIEGTFEGRTEEYDAMIDRLRAAIAKAEGRVEEESNGPE